MKVKMKLDVASIKNWMLEHGEKLAFAIVAVVFLWLTYSAIGHESLEASKEPPNLTSLASTVQQHVTNSTWDQQREGIKVVDYAERAVVKEVSASNYALPNLLDPPVTDPKSKRIVPEFAAIEGLRVGTGFDVFEGKVSERAGGKNLLAQPWVVVCGIVPIDRQREQYAQAFGNAVGANATRDVPKYEVPVLERAVVNGAAPDQLEWKPVEAAGKYEAQWVSAGEEVVPPQFVDDKLTGRLGPLVGNRKWGEQVSHPKIHSALAEKAKPGQDDPKKVEPAQREKDKDPGIRLLRMFDYSVEPGQKYRYRIVLKVENPNFEVGPQYLKEPQSARDPLLMAAPSEPTSMVTVPDGHRVLAGVIDPGSRFSEPTATVLVTAIEREQGLELATEMTKVQRGAVANTPNKTQVKVRDPANRQVRTVEHDFQSNILVLDMYGGEDLPSRRRMLNISAPGELLLLDADGNMVVRSEVNDLAPYETSLVREEAPKRPLEDDKKKAPIRGR